MLCDSYCSVALPHIAMGCSMVCDCGISWLYSLTFLYIDTIITDCMLGGQPNYGWQLCFPLSLHARGSDFRLYDGSDLKTYLLTSW